MIRHQKESRTRSPYLNAKSWKTGKSIEEIYNSIAEEETEIIFPYKLEEQENGQEAIFQPVHGNYQISAHEYDKDWKDTEIDFIYFGKIDDKVNSTIREYREMV